MQPIHLFSFKGIPVSFHPMFLLLLLILSYGMGSMMAMLIFAVCAIIGILVHEFGHALVARKYGLNPEITLTGFGGNTKYKRSVGPKKDFFITLTGPVANLVLGGISYLVLFVIGMTIGLDSLMKFTNVYIFLNYMFLVNIFWGIFNLLPAKPMDGYKVLGFILSKFLKNTVAEKVSIIISAIFVLLILGWSILNNNIFMIILSAFFVLANLNDLATLFKSGGSKEKVRMIGIQAESIYERGLVASRNHDWKNLEVLGHQMKQVAEDKDQIQRAYELLTVACTNLGKYEEALNYSEHARQTDSVKQARERCRRILGE